MLLTSARRFFLSGWFWGGVGVAVVIFLPNFLWQVRHGFISVHFLQHIHVRDVGQGRANGFLQDQFIICANIVCRAFVDCGVGEFLPRPALSNAWMDVRDSACAVYAGQGARVLSGCGVSDADGDGRGCGGAMGESLKQAMADALWRVFFLPAWRRGGVCFALIVPLASSGPLTTVCVEEQWRSAGGDWVGRVGATGCVDSRLAARRAASECWSVYWRTMGSRARWRFWGRRTVCRCRSA